jgi:hypothetical protein
MHAGRKIRMNATTGAIKTNLCVTNADQIIAADAHGIDLVIGKW